LRRLYTAVLAKRLYAWTDETGALPDCQGGFRPGYRTADNIFILRCLVERSIAQNTPLYLVLADMTKAFDLVDREILFGSLRNMGAWG
ncbi:hypothetical protein DFH27DRAFT_464860, partial [Peziza echinospora]